LSDETREALDDLESESDDSDDEGFITSYDEMTIMKAPCSSSIRSASHWPKLLIVFNNLSTLINSGRYPEFMQISSDLFIDLEMQCKSPKVYDVQFIVLYLTASYHLIRNKLGHSEEAIRKAFEISSRTSNPTWTTEHGCHSFFKMLAKPGEWRQQRTAGELG
jgi:hypothetical protein